MEQISLFDNRETAAPLASRLRPDSLENYVGQKHLIGKGRAARIRGSKPKQCSKRKRSGMQWIKHRSQRRKWT